MTEIVLQKSGLSDGSIRYDMIGKNIPDNFLGIATDLRFQNAFVEGDYLRMQNGEIFNQLPSAKQPIVMVRAQPEKGTLVVGITLKSDNLPVLNDGVLASFWMKGTSPIVVGFERQVFSQFYQGSRRDSEAVWTVEDLPVLQVNQVEPKPVSQVSVQSGAGVVQAGLQPVVEDKQVSSLETVNQTALLEALRLPVVFPAADFAGGWWWLILLVSVMAAIPLAGLYLKGKKGRDSGSFPTGSESQIKLDY